jgi:hypothetical protein
MTTTGDWGPLNGNNATSPCAKTAELRVAFTLKVIFSSMCIGLLA